MIDMIKCQCTAWMQLLRFNDSCISEVLMTDDAAIFVVPVSALVHAVLFLKMHRLGQLHSNGHFPSKKE